MIKHRKMSVLILAVAAVVALATTGGVAAQEVAIAALTSLNEVPAVIEGSRGGFSAVINGLDSIDYSLTYDRTDTSVLQSHIHIGQAGVNGAVTVFLCTNLGNGPAGTPACPAEGEVTGTLTAAELIPVAGQGISSFAGVIRAMRQGVAYVNVHTEEYPGGELRGQVEVGGPR